MGGREVKERGVHGRQEYSRLYPCCLWRRPGRAGLETAGKCQAGRRRLHHLHEQRYVIENNRLGIPAFFVTESYNGVDAEGSTRFGRPISLSASWNRELVRKVYDTVGREARARGLHLTHSPVAFLHEGRRNARRCCATGTKGRYGCGSLSRRSVCTATGNGEERSGARSPICDSRLKPQPKTESRCWSLRLAPV